ncbi:hypothetical protein EDM59_19385 [Brevibacillus nitrificans]|uniref:Uncharacterized protein n=1 Tax=Brevibacillus nitrificans TaxID=651560 RepID=A0A3M8D5L2_9BACL|nr:hypothetical protein [Brevibacillus nitrificans]RNB83198.1 hypothetical protein EDM59_19385 [Brevibacillus nitrificans]
MKSDQHRYKYDVTRYLCAAAELNRNVRDTIFEHVVQNPYKFVAKNYGVDLSRVVRQCLRIQTRDLATDLLLSAIMLFYVIIHFSHKGLIYGIITFIPNLISSWAFIFTLFVICGSRLWSYWEVSRNLSKDNFGNSLHKETLVESIYAERLLELKQLEEGNTTYYSGYTPFVGAGNRIGGWSFVFSTQSEMDQNEYVDISLKKMYDTMGEKIKDLQIKGMSIEDGLFVDGKTLRNHPEFLPDVLSAPNAKISDEVMQDYVGKFTEQKRYYKIIQISGWQGNFIFSTFFRLTKNDRQMFVEVNYYLLPPLKKNYYAIDQLRVGIPASIIGKTILISIIPAIVSPFLAPFRFISRLNLLLNKRGGNSRKVERQVKDNPVFDYGAAQSLREIVASDKMQNFFQDADVIMYQKQVERYLMEGMTEYLKSQGVDVSEFNKRKEAIIQQGITINGGNFEVENLVGGNQIKHNIIKKVESVVKES